MISAILLAAGESKRFGSKNKLIENFKKKPLINHVLKSLINSKIDEIFIILGFEKIKIKKVILKNKKIIFVINKKYKKGISTSIKCGLKKISNNSTGFIIVHGDMPFIKSSHINKIYTSLLKKNYLVHALKYKNRIGNPIGFNKTVINRFKKLKGDIGE